MAIKYSERYFTTAEAAAELGVSTDSIKRYCNATPPRLKAEKVGHSWMIPKSEIERYKKTASATGRPKNISR